MAHFINEQETLATELLHEVKASAKRWFFIAMIELVIIAGFVIGIMWYVSLPTEEYSIEQTADQNSIEGDGTITQSTGASTTGG